jgi:hypothetical protein
MKNPIRVTLSKASPVGSREVASLFVEAVVDINEELPNNTSESDHRLFYDSQARSLVSAMFHTLPGGLIDAILIELMQRRASIFHVPFIDPE